MCRLLLAPAVVYSIVNGEARAAFWLFVVAGISDGVDGFIAKRFHSETELGRYLDPLADKVLLVGIYVALCALGEMPDWLVILVVGRDLFIVCAVNLSWLLSRPVAVAPLLISKINTASQIVLAAVVLADLGFDLSQQTLRDGMIFVVAFLTVLSATAYLFEWVRHLAAGVGPVVADSPADGGTR
jgi:cardiolipin synthase